MASLPTVLYPLTLPALLHRVRMLKDPTLIICSSRDAFLQDLVLSLQEAQNEDYDSSLQDLVTPTLYNLSTTQHVSLAFCASVQALLAYLTAYGRDEAGYANQQHDKRKLILVNPLALHAPTSAFSAQGLSRCFAAAAETALRTGTVLHMVECRTSRRNAELTDEDMHKDEEPAADVHMQDEYDPWQQEVPILNVSARRFGSGSSERAWAGRTVTAKRIAARWFMFHNLETSKTHEEHE